MPSYFFSELLSFFFLSLIWAFLGHKLWQFYGFGWRSMLGLLGIQKKKVEAAATAEPEGPGYLDRQIRGILQEHGLQLLGLFGALLAAGAGFWLLDDLVSDIRLQRWIQLGSLLLLTGALGVWGWRLRRPGSDPLGTGLLLLAFTLIPIDAWFYEKFILGYTTRSAYQIALLLAAVAYGITRSTGSRTFAWLAPGCLLSGILLVGYKLEWPASLESYVAVLCAPLFLGLGLWSDSLAHHERLARPLQVTAAVASMIALVCYLDAREDVLPWLPLAISILGGGTLSVTCYLWSDLRGVLLVAPYLGILFQGCFERFGTDYGPLGTLAAVTALGLLAAERVLRRGSDRRKGLDPRCSVPALALLLVALVTDGLSVIFLLSRIEALDLSAQLLTWDLDTAGRLWGEVERTVYYLARLDGALEWAALSGLLTFLGLAYLGGQSAIPLLAYSAGIPLFVSISTALLRWLPFELHGLDYGFFLTLAFLACAAFTAATTGAGRLSPARGATVACHLLVPVTYWAYGYRVFHPGTVPGWFECLLLAVLGVQCLVQARLAGLPVPVWRLGNGLLAFPWCLAIGSLARYADPAIEIGLIFLGLAVTATLLWWALVRRDVYDAVIAATGLAFVLLATLARVMPGDISAKIVVLGFGLLLLWAGARTRHRAASAGIVLLLASGALGVAPAAAGRLTTRESLEQLGRANPTDPLIAVTLRSAGIRTKGETSTGPLWNKVRTNLGALSGLDSAQAAMQLMASPLRLRASGEETTLPLYQIPAASPRSLDYVRLASELPGAKRLPPEAGDDLDRVPADRIQLRFSSTDALARTLSFYESAGQSLLSVLAPGLAVPSPAAAFRRALGVDLLDSAQACTAGALLIGDPYLGLAPDLVLVLKLDGETAAIERARQWTDKFGDGRVAQLGSIACLSTSTAALEGVVDCLAGLEPETLSRAPDFRYASLLELPAPSGRLFIGEAAVTRLVSPAFWIASHRRADCLANLAELEAARAYGLLTSRPLPDSPDAAHRSAVDRKWMEKGAPCRSGGTLLDGGPGGVAACSLHGSRLDPAPLERAPVDRAMRSETAAYSDFRFRYNQLYGRFIDPISIGIDAGRDRLELQTLILPAARQPEYQTLASWAAEQTSGMLPRETPYIALPPGRGDAAVALAVRAPQWLRNLGHYYFNRYGFWGYGREPALARLDALLPPGALGASVGLLLFSGDLSFAEPIEKLWKSPDPPPLAAFREVRMPKPALAYLKELTDGRGHRRYDKAEGYGLRLLGRRHVYGAVDDTSLLVGFSEDRIEKMLAAPRGLGKLANAVAWMKVRPGELWSAARSYAPLSEGLLPGRCRELLASMQGLVDLGAPWPLDEKARPAGGPFLPSRPLCPSGGGYSLSGELVSCSIHGTLESPQHGPPAPGSPLESLLRSLASIETEISIHADGIRTRVVIESATR